MPSAAPKPCTNPGCRRLIPYGQQCPDHPRNWHKQDKAKGNRHERGYGTAWTKLRDTVMARDKGLCQPCLSSGRYTPASEVDHIKPKAEGGTDDTGNLQSICRQCHRTKTAYEARGESAQAMPDWLPYPLVPVLVIVGPPASGKTTYAQKIARPQDLRVDLHEIASHRLGIPPDAVRALGTSALKDSMRTRNALLASLADTGCPYSRGILTVTAGKPEHRQWWKSKLRATVVVMDTPRDVCKDRIRAMRLPPAREIELIRLVDNWK